MPPRLFWVGSSDVNNIARPHNGYSVVFLRPLQSRGRPPHGVCGPYSLFIISVLVNVLVIPYYPEGLGTEERLSAGFRVGWQGRTLCARAKPGRKCANVPEIILTVWSSRRESVFWFSTRRARNIPPVHRQPNPKRAKYILLCDSSLLFPSTWRLYVIKRVFNSSLKKAGL